MAWLLGWLSSTFSEELRYRGLAITVFNRRGIPPPLVMDIVFVPWIHKHLRVVNEARRLHTLFGGPAQRRHYSSQPFFRFAGHRLQLRVIPHDAEHLRRVDN